MCFLFLFVVGFGLFCCCFIFGEGVCVLVYGLFNESLNTFLLTALSASGIRLDQPSIQ